MELTCNGITYALHAIGVPGKTIESFINKHKRDKYIWRLFEQYALKAAEKGKKLGAKAIMERVRWECEIEDSGEFKINNDYTAYYARVFAIAHPEYADFFEFRQVKGLSE